MLELVVFHPIFIFLPTLEVKVRNIKMKSITTGMVAIAVLLTSNLSTAIGQTMPHQGGMMNGGMMGMMKSGEQSDRAFIEMMIPHHDGAVKMADIILKRTKSPELRQLALAIKQGQSREIGQMKTWYQKWYQTTVPALSKSGGMGMMGNGGMGMMSGSGMGKMMAAQIQQLETATDSDRVFLEEMIPHHKMALMMTAHVVDSERPELRTLAKNIMQTQTAEIDKMRQLSKTLDRQK